MRILPVLGVLLLLAPASAALLAAPAPLAVQDVTEAVLEARAAAVLDGPSLAGKTPRGWLGWAEARLDEPAAADAAPVALDAAVADLYAAVGVAPTTGQLDALRASVAALDPGWAAALAPLVADVAGAYAVQAGLAALVDVAALQERRLAFAPEATAQAAVNAEGVLGSIARFRAQAAALPPTEAFLDPVGLVVLGSSGDDVFVQAAGTFPDPVLLVDPSGDDLDLTRAGGACPGGPIGAASCNGLALSVRLDLAGNDIYRFTDDHGVAQGSGAFGGLGILVDAAGDDLYEATQLASHGPFLTYYINGVMQGAGEAGVGLMVDLAGDDVYRFYGFSVQRELFGQGQGFAGLGGLGLLVDGAGADVYDARVTCTGQQAQFCGLYVQSTVIYPGVSVQLDAGPENDVYWGILVAPQEDYYAQGFAAFGGFAVLVDEGGDEDYYASATSTNPSGGVSLTCAFGTAEYAGAVGIMIDGDGDDRYVTETISPNSPYTMAEGFSLASFSLFWDVRGDDWHEMRAVGPNPVIVGRGTGGDVSEAFAVYIDSGGMDTYVDPVGEDGSVWGPHTGELGGVGIDVNLL